MYLVADFGTSGVMQRSIVVIIWKLSRVIFSHAIHSFFFQMKKKKRENKGRKIKSEKMEKKVRKKGENHKKEKNSINKSV